MRLRNRLSAYLLTSLLLLGATLAGPLAQENPTDPSRGLLDQVLDVNVRDGFVYYRALKLERGKLDRYLNQLATTEVGALPRDGQIAFWLNAYNALVLRTVIDHYPIVRRTTDYPAHSIRQIPGAFERVSHRVAGRMVTLDEIEQKILADYHDPRVFLALGRGSIGGGRLRSEAFVPERLEAQLAEVASECISRSECVRVDRENNKVLASPIFSWREKEFAAAYADHAPARFATRSPIERAILAFVEPRLLTTEREFLEGNMFEVAFLPFDWSLNDLTGRGGR